MKQFEGKVVLVTGGSRNTGLEIVDRFLREGATVFFCGTTAESVEKGAAELKRRGLSGFTPIVCDVGNLGQVTAMMDGIEREAGQLDVVVSNAANMGIGHGGPLEMTDEQFLSVLNVNILGGFRVVQAACNRFFMKQERDPHTDQRGVVVFVGSNSSERVSRKRLAYVTSKGGMDTMVKALGVDLGPLGVRVNMVAPGYIWSDRWNWLTDAIKERRHRNVPTGHEATGQDVAAAVLFLASPGARGFQGARLLMDGGSCAQLYPVDCEDDTSTMREH